MNTETLNYTLPKDILQMDAQQLIDRVKGKTAIFTHEGKTLRGEIVGGTLNKNLIKHNQPHPYIFNEFNVIVGGQKILVPAAIVTIK